MAKRLPTIYLAGAIRDNRPEDAAWRELFIQTLNGLAVFLNPLAGKKFNSVTNTWSLYGHKHGTKQAGGRYIVKKDFWSVDRADILVINMLSLAERYPFIGSLIEYGRATKTGALVFCIVPEKYTGHGHTAETFGLHPFIEENSAIVFHDVESCVSFLKGELLASSGIDPHYGGTS